MGNVPRGRPIRDFRPGSRLPCPISRLQAFALAPYRGRVSYLRRDSTPYRFQGRFLFRPSRFGYSPLDKRKPSGRGLIRLDRFPASRVQVKEGGGGYKADARMPSQP